MFQKAAIMDRKMHRHGRFETSMPDSPKSKSPRLQWLQNPGFQAPRGHNVTYSSSFKQPEPPSNSKPSLLRSAPISVTTQLKVTRFQALGPLECDRVRQKLAHLGECVIIIRSRVRRLVSSPIASATWVSIALTESTVACWSESGAETASCPA